MNVHAFLGARAEKSERGRRTGGQPEEGVRYAYMWIDAVEESSLLLLISFFLLIRFDHLDDAVTFRKSLSHLHPYDILFAVM